MANFMIRFLLCNVFISGIVGILLIAKWVFRNNLSSRMQYNLWLLLLGLLAVPFIPFRRKGQILRSTPNTAPLICGACNTQPEGLSTMA